MTGAVSAFALLAGCEDKRRHQPTQQVAFAETRPTLAEDAPPKDVVLAGIDAIIRAQEARRGGLGSPQARTDYERAMGELHWLAARPQIHDAVRRSGAYEKDITESAAATVIIESWLSVLAHYVEGIDRDSMRYRMPPGNTTCLIYLEATNPHDVKALADIEERLRQSQEQGTTSAPGDSAATEGPSDRRSQLARHEGLALPLTTGIDMVLAKAGEGWKISRINLVAPTRPGLPIGSAGALPSPTSAPSAPHS